MGELCALCRATIRGMADREFVTGSVFFSVAQLLAILLKIRHKKKGHRGRSEPVLEPQVPVPTLILAQGGWWHWCLELSEVLLSFCLT